MNSYEARQQARRERLEARAKKAAAGSASASDRAHSMAQAIPLGQPVLVGHHSEGRDRSYRARISSGFEKAAKLGAESERLARAAAAVGTAGVSSDDPEAVAKLRAEFREAEARQGRMRFANAAIRQGKTHEAQVAALTALGYSPEFVEKLLTPDDLGNVGFAKYALTNNGANMRRIKQRIAELERRRAQVDVVEQGPGYVYREDVADNRVAFEFAGKPDEATRSLLKTHGFRWSPSRSAWVRQLNDAGRRAAEAVRVVLVAEVRS